MVFLGNDAELAGVAAPLIVEVVEAEEAVDGACRNIQFIVLEDRMERRSVFLLIDGDGDRKLGFVVAEKLDLGNFEFAGRVDNVKAEVRNGVLPRSLAVGVEGIFLKVVRLIDADIEALGLL